MVLPLATFTLERALGMMKKAVVDIIDVREFMPFIFTMMGLRALIVAKIKILQGPTSSLLAARLAYFHFVAKFEKAKLNVSGTGVPCLIYFMHQLIAFQRPCITTTMAYSIFAIVNLCARSHT